MFKIRNTKPTKNDLCYVMDDTGGWSWCIKGKPTDKECNVLANCVGYGCGRFNEIINEIEGTKGMRYPTLNCNAENFIERAEQAGLEIVDHPVLGGIMVMQKGATLSGNDGAGHVFAVEDILEVDANGIPTKIYTSESAYKGSAFYNVTRSNSNGRWGHGSAYSFRGCIVNPAVGAITSFDVTPVDPFPGVSDEELATRVWAGEFGNGEDRAKALGIRYDAVQALVNKGIGKPEPKPEVTSTLNVGDKVKIVSYGNASCYGDSHRAGGIGYERTILDIHKNKRYPYEVGSGNTTTGFYKAEALKKI